MYQIDIMSRKPLYEQLVEQVERFVLRGVLAAEEQMPSVRGLSEELSVNPNTVQKAYSELDRRGIVYSVPGKGCFISPNARTFIGNRREGELSQLTEEIYDLALAGITRERVIGCVDEAYRKKGENDDPS
ncbi:MAG: GntR family transcriptional regulator [Lachnospiraceae bacterium]|nr:GntR family transcriptional regulator [Lachnospiraceae bacterium]